MKHRLFSKLSIPLGIAGVLVLTTGAVCAEDGMAVETFGGFTTIESDDMVGLRGRDGNTIITVESNQSLEATITSSSFNADTINSGDVNIGENALENFSGIGNFSIVTGNNNAVNTSVGVSVQMQ